MKYMQKKKSLAIKCIIYLAIVFILSNLGYAQDIQIYIVNPLEKIFRDFKCEESSQLVKIESAANEYEPAQFVIKSNQKLENVSVSLTELKNEQTGHVISEENIQWNYVGYVPVIRNTNEAECGEHQDIPEGELIRKAPFDVPDPLLEDRRITIEANQSQPVWITVFVPSQTQPGIYDGKIIVQTSAVKKNIPIELTVYSFELPKERHLYLTNWFEINHIAMAHKVELFSEGFWQILSRYAKNLARHRQNVVYTPWHLVKVYREIDGELSFDYTNFDKFVETFFTAGVEGRIELYHVAHHGKLGRAGKEILLYKINPIDRETGNKISLPSDDGMAALLVDLHKHLKVKGWFNKTIVHVADEPSFHNIQSWRKTREFVQENFPGIKTIDAIGGTGYEKYLDIMVPLTRDLHTWFDDYKLAQKSGIELWFYTCCVPYGKYANRFLDYHLSKTRILHWMNYFTGTEGFLHWGLTYGWEDPFGPAPRFPPGDSHIIYPGSNGPMNSIRWEMVREGLEDYEYLWLLEHKTKQVMKNLGIEETQFPADFRSREICGKLVRSLTDYTTNPEDFYTARKLIASEIIAINKHPLILLATDPSTNEELVTGPAVTKVYGFVEEGTTVTINGKNVMVNPVDGSFIKAVGLTHNENIVKVEATLKDKRKFFERKYIISIN